MKKIAFFGGSFNPPNNIHIDIIKNIKNKLNMDEVYFVPVGNYYNKTGLIDVKHRFEMLKLSVENEKDINVLDITLNEKNTLKAIDVFYKIRNMYINDDIYFIMGADNFSNILSWKNASDLVENFKIIIIERENINIKKIINENSILKNNKNNFIIISKSSKLDNVSSSIIRNKIISNQDVKDCLNHKVYDYILKNKLYFISTK